MSTKRFGVVYFHSTYERGGMTYVLIAKRTIFPLQMFEKPYTHDRIIHLFIHMFINFGNIITWFFKSFDIAGDTKLLEKLEKDGIRFLMIIKKHWIYSILMSWRVVFVIVMACANVYLLVSSRTHPDTVTLGLGALLGINVLWWLIVVIVYIRRFHSIQGNKPYIEDIYSAIRKSRLSDEAFENFFNQTVFLLIILVGIAAFIVFRVTMEMLLSGLDSNMPIAAANILLILIQTGLFYGYLNAMINQEMDFKVVVPGQILFFNQLGIFGDSQTMNAEKIKTINSKHAGLFGSFINYGTIMILTE